MNKIFKQFFYLSAEWVINLEGNFSPEIPDLPF